MSSNESTPAGSGGKRVSAPDDHTANKPQPAAISLLALWALAIFGRSRGVRDAPEATPDGRGPPP